VRKAPITCKAKLFMHGNDRGGQLPKGRRFNGAEERRRYPVAVDVFLSSLPLTEGAGVVGNGQKLGLAVAPGLRGRPDARGVAIAAGVLSDLRSRIGLAAQDAAAERRLSVADIAFNWLRRGLFGKRPSARARRAQQGEGAVFSPPAMLGRRGPCGLRPREEEARGWTRRRTSCRRGRAWITTW